MSRVKLVTLLIVLSSAGILLGQNRQLLGLKFFCPDAAAQDCLYRTPDFPLAAWMALFFVAGIISSLVWQLLNQLANNGSRENKKQQTFSSQPKTTASTRKSRFNKTPVQPPSNDFPLSDWEEEANKDWESTENVKSSRERERVRTPRSQQPQNTQAEARKDSVYSYNFSETTKKKNQEPQDSKDKDIKDNKKDDVYDATYRTVNSPKNSPDNYSERKDDGEQWI